MVYFALFSLITSLCFKQQKVYQMKENHRLNKDIDKLIKTLHRLCANLDEENWYDVYESENTKKNLQYFYDKL